MTDYIKLLKSISFGLIGLIVLAMMAATVLEKIYGTAFVARYIYGSPVFVACWGLIAATSVVYLLKRNMQKQILTLLLHLSFVLILLGALVTHIWGLQGSVHLRRNVVAGTFTTAGGEEKEFPFGVSLKEFNLMYYPGTMAPMDFVSSITIDDGREMYEGKVAMNHIYSFRNYRFYQSKYDADGGGTTLSVAYDPYGIPVTYMGYGLLLLTMILFFFQKQSTFRQLLRHPLLKRTLVGAGMIFFSAMGIQAAGTPHALPKQTAGKFGDLYIYYNDRICPLQTLARDFTVKLYGKPSYKGMTAEQVLTGWFFFYDDWKEEPVIRIKSKEVHQLLEIEGSYARLVDFADFSGYKLDKGMQSGTGIKDMRGIEEANEKFSLISMVSTGSILKIYPYVASPDSQMVWYSLADRLPRDMPSDLWSFIRNSMNYVAEQVARNDYQEVDNLLDKIKKYQVREAGLYAPSETRFKAEKWYNGMNDSRPLAMLFVTVGIVAFVFYCRRMIVQKQEKTPVTALLLFLLGAGFAYLCTTIVLRGYVSGHLPMSNGHETMQLMAACVALLTFFFYRRIPIVIAFGFLLCGLALLVSMLGEANPQITQLMPVLSSPLLSFHVVVIMIAYSLLAFIMLNGVTAIILHYSRKDCTVAVERLQVISRIILYPAVFLLAVGIFIGAVWANVSWGRYWGWDPKEVWALVTMLVYALALHPASLPWFRRPMFFHVFSIIAFFSVLITYFGVNFLLGGMHSYANS
ncbi:MAG: cytochrome c biogenesis protein CcsA [Bacteroides sp.]|nr:cytochrome c biogenesis protein CcsA [Bacteroides sp.]